MSQDKDAAPTQYISGPFKCPLDACLDSEPHGHPAQGLINRIGELERQLAAIAQPAQKQGD